MPKRSGFTLIELLVVVAIIAILSVMGMAVYSGVLNNAHEAKAKGDLDAFVKAYELRFDAATGEYPPNLTAADFVGGIPVPLEGGNYLDPKCTGGKTGSCDLLGPGNYDRPFELCITLDSGNVCKKSSQLSEASTGKTLNKITIADLSSGGGTGGTGGGTSGGGTGGGGTSPSPTAVAGGGGTGGGGTGGTGGTSSPSPAPTASASPASTCQPNTSCTFKALSAAMFKRTGAAGFNPSCDLKQDGAINISDTLCLSSSTTLYGGLQAYWDMEETSGDRLNYDINKTALKLTVSGASLGTETGPSNMGNAAGNFQSSNAYLTMDDQPEVSITGTKTWAFWMKNTGRNTQIILRKGAGTDTEYSVYKTLLPAVRFVLLGSGGGSICGTTGVTNFINSDQWNLVIIWYEAGSPDRIGMQVGKAGTLGTPVTQDCTAPARDLAGQLGVGGLSGNNTNGYIDGLGIWNRLLTDQEKNELYNSGNGKQL